MIAEGYKEVSMGYSLGYSPKEPTNESTNGPARASDPSLLEVVAMTEESLRIIENKVISLFTSLFGPEPQQDEENAKDAYTSVATLAEKSNRTASRIHSALDYLIERTNN